MEYVIQAAPERRHMAVSFPGATPKAKRKRTGTDNNGT